MSERLEEVADIFKSLVEKVDDDIVNDNDDEGCDEGEVDDSNDTLITKIHRDHCPCNHF